MVRTSLSTTVTSNTIKRNHVQQIVDAWNGTSDTTAAPLILNHSTSKVGSAVSPFKIMVNAASTDVNSNSVKALHITKQNSDNSTSDVFYVTASGTIYPNAASTLAGGTAATPALKFYSTDAPVTGLYGDIDSVNITVRGSKTFGSQYFVGTGISQNIFDVALVSSDQMTSDFKAIILKYLKPTTSTNSSGSVGVKQTWRSYSYDSTLKYRDYSFVAKSNSFSGSSTAEGYIELVNEYNGSGTDVSIAKFHSSGLITGSYAPDSTWPPTTATASTETAATTTFPRGSIPVYQVTQTGASSPYNFSGKWGQLAAGTNGYILVADSTVTNGVRWTENAGGGFVRSFLLMGG